MLYLYVKQQQSEKRCHFHLNEKQWDVISPVEIQLKNQEIWFIKH